MEATELRRILDFIWNMEDIRRDIPALEQQTDGLLKKIVGASA